ncbi:hypothetical protein ABE65_006425 [Fictibacillus phosphorivorans]|uniref:Uncharacterized protein n=1 Tax=Fictibacillus phosphorivorans TaxID=1221500 RepID=A0A160IK38_9BACL|nr:hypothetical protein ABE65_006425 [Fictibacillus phosphorivorans]
MSLRFRLLGYSLLVVIVFPNLLPFLISNYLPEGTRAPVQLLLNFLILFIVIPFLKLAYQKKNAGIITLFLFLILYLLTMSIIPFIGVVTQ